MNGIKNSRYLRIVSLLCFIFIASHFFLACALFPQKSGRKAVPPFSPSDVFAPEEERIPKEGDIKDRASHTSLAYMEEELSKLGLKVKALEAKLEVLQEKISLNRIAREQPRIQVEGTPFFAKNDRHRDSVESSQSARYREESSFSFPVEEDSRWEDDSANLLELAKDTREVQASPEKPVRKKKELFAETAFQESMSLYEEKKYSNAVRGFFQFYKKYPEHVLASHALYWAGQASAQQKNWREAVKYWMLLESRYSFRSIYMPEVWVGLSRAFTILGELEEAKKYKELLQGIFPNSPAAESYKSNKKFTESRG